ncbi:MAG: hypothetical protein KKD77_20170, partial [Gammaproteobacteria bacterium]|nr:hypothetical protein [Gammaproteobacteria bacterium]
MVEVLLGKREVTSFAEEGTYGSFTNPTVIIKNARVEPQSSEDWQEILQAGSGVIYPTAQVGNKIRAFRLTYNPQDWRMLSFILGGSSLTDANPIYTHSYTGYDTDPVSFSLQRDIYASTHSVRKWNGCKVNTATLSWNIAGGGMTGRFVELALDCVAQDVSIATSASGSPSAASTDLFEAKHVQLTLNTSAVNELLSGTVVWENKLHDSMYADYASSGEISEP